MNSCRSSEMRYCSIPGCENKHYGNGYCNKHRLQLKREGKIYTTRRDPNEFEVLGDTVAIHLRGSDMHRIAFVDVQDIGLVCGYKWRWAKNGSVVSDIDGKTTRLHRHLIGNDCGVIDHIDGDPLNNRRGNLRECTQQENTYNASLSKRNRSGVKGVHYKKGLNKWVASIRHDGKSVYLGCFPTLTDAAKARESAALKLHGEYAYEARP